MKNADGCIIIGFSFRDQHLNEIFESFVKDKKPLIILSPSSVENICKNFLNESVPDYEKGRVNVFPSDKFPNICCLPDPLTKENVKHSMDLAINIIKNLLEKNKIQNK